MSSFISSTIFESSSEHWKKSSIEFKLQGFFNRVELELDSLLTRLNYITTLIASS